MRKNLQELINKTIIFQYNLPNIEKNIFSTVFSTHNDHCYLSNNDDSLIEIIYNSIIEYSFNEFDIEKNSYENLLVNALKTKIKYSENDNNGKKQRYGFYGEVLLYSILSVFYSAHPYIARGYLYSPLSKMEAPGYDAYHLIESDEKIELWLGEVKFHKLHSTAIKSVMKNIEKTLSDEYLEANIIALTQQKDKINLNGSKIKDIVEKWDLNPNIVVIDEIKKHKMELVYPILLLYDDDNQDYDINIKKIPEYIEKNYPKPTFNISIEYKLFFILVPINNVKNIKQKVIECIESKKQLML